MTGIKKINLISAVLVSLSLCGGCTLEKAGNSSQDQAVQEDNETEQVKTEKAEKEEINEMHLRDKDSLYENADDTSVVTMYLTVSKGNSSENTYHTWKEINSYSVYDYEDMGVERYQVAGLLQVGDENGPIEGEVGYGESVPNATVQIRGQTSSQNAQKNYKIELKKNKGTWRGQRTINLNKHMTEGMRFRNKLAYDLIRGIPQMVGLRTQFVHLYVKDNTEESDGKFEDYGIYTQVEQLNKTALKSHGLDSNGQLYKINSFEFYRYEDIIKKEDDAGYDKTAFEKMLENRRNYADFIREREDKYYPYSTENDMLCWEKKPKLLPLSDGQTFDLGGRILTAYSCPGHTPGEMVFIDSKTRYLFCADACNRNLLLIQSGDHTEGRYISVEKAAKAMERIVSMKDQYDHVINSHHDYRGFGAPLADYVVDQALECMKKIVDGTAEIREIPDPLQLNATKTVAVYGDVFITYSKEGVYETR